MPQASPSGGLSLFIHIIINLMVFGYNKIIKSVGISKKNIISKYFNKLTSKEGDTNARRVLSYLLVSFVLVVMSSNFVFVTVRLFKLEDLRISSKIESVINAKYANVTNPEKSNALMSENTNYSPLSLHTEEPKNEAFMIEKLSNESFSSLVDFMESLGIVNTSFEARAELAVQSGVIGDVSEYNGSLSQNREVIRKLQEELKTHIKPE